ncbi:MAG: hypothetical protein H0T78_04350 [Longispora sp.]|nr:hypothetical protein [Longispora sp. (in: high G+C Gram-positive bacteria)]
MRIGLLDMDLSSPDGEFLSEIKGFDSWKHFHRVRLRVEEAVARGTLTEVPTVGWYDGPMTEQHWFRTPAGTIWRLATPDPPSPGVLEVVEDPTEDNSVALRLMQEAAYRGDLKIVRDSVERLGTDAPEAIAHNLRVHLAQPDEWNRRHPLRYRLQGLLRRLGISGRSQ